MARVQLRLVALGVVCAVVAVACGGGGADSVFDVRVSTTLAGQVVTTASAQGSPDTTGTTIVGETTVAPPVTSVDGQVLSPTTIPRATTTTELDASISRRHTEAKALAADVVTKLLTYSAEMDHEAVVAQVVGGSFRISNLVEETPNLYLDGASSVGEVLFGQLGGMRPTSTSVMVVATQVADVGGSTEVFTRTIDVRLMYRAGAWRFDFVFDDGGSPIERPASLFPEAVDVVGDDRILMSDSARWDIYRGLISPTLLSLMSEISARTPFEVTVLSSGHPFFVFATNRQSLHTRGRAVDIFSVGGVPVGADHDTDSDIYALVQWIYDHPNVRSVGSPWDLDGPGGRSFTDEVHLDHIHIGLLDEVDNAP